MNKEYTVKASNPKVVEVISKITNDLALNVYKKQDCKVMIQPLDFRGMNALKAYWVMVGNVVKWDAGNNDYKADLWDEWFKREANLSESVDLMPFWQMKYPLNKIEADRIMDDTGYYYKSDTYSTFTVEGFKKHNGISLGERYITKTRSISNKGDVTKEEMSILLMTVIKFGADNQVPNCFIKDTELENMLKSYDK